jgi:hypothetical protein
MRLSFIILFIEKSEAMNYKRIIIEEITKDEVKRIAKEKTRSLLNSKEFKDAVKEITAKAISNLYKEMYFKNNYWMSAVKNS